MRTYRASFLVQHKDRPSRVIFRHEAADLDALKAIILSDPLQLVEQFLVSERDGKTRQIDTRRPALLDLSKAYVINYEDCIE